MTITTVAGVGVDLNAEGFFENPDQWTPEIAV